MTVRSTFSVEYPIDRTVIAAQDVLNQLQWGILEMSTSRIVAMMPGLTPVQMMNFPKMTVDFKGNADKSDLSITVTVAGGTLGGRKKITGLIGMFTNALSLRVQTDSIAINPTVAIGEGQGGYGQQPLSGTRDRASQLKDLKELLDSGILTEDEFATEKARILSDG